MKTNQFIPSIQPGVQLSPKVADFLCRPKKLLINGKWVEAASGRTFNTFNPATGDPLAEVAEAGAEDVDRAVAAANRALNGGWGSMKPAERARVLLRFADLIEQQVDELAALESLDNGKSFVQAKEGDIPFAVDVIRYMAGLARGSHGETVEALVYGAKQTRLGHGFDPQATMGPLVSREQLERVEGYVGSAAGDGFQTSTGGKRGTGSGYFYEPTVIVNARPDSRIMREEIFGPVVMTTPFESVDEVIAAANDTPYGLAAGVWTRDIQKAHRVAHALKAGTVWINTYHVYDSALPFGGYKESGWGRELGRNALDNYTETKSVVAAL